VIYLQLMGVPLRDIMMTANANSWLHAQLKLQQLRIEIEDIVEAMGSDHNEHTTSQIHSHATTPL